MSSKTARVESDATETNFTIRVPASLKRKFMATLKANDRTGSNVVRDFMREVVETNGRSIKATPREAAALSAEQRRRQEAVAYGQASVALEGFPITEEATRLAEQFVAGNISLSEYASTPHGGVRER